MGLAMTPTQTVHDILNTLPAAGDDPKAVQFVAVGTIRALRSAASNAVDEEELIHRLLARCRGIVYQHVIRCQVQADADAVLGENSHPRSEHMLLDARELLAAVDARLGVQND
jgi:uroporphyrinogen-III decarboxylase